MFGIDSLRDHARVSLILKSCLPDEPLCPFDQREGLSYTWIDTDLRESYGIGHFLQ